MSIIMILIIIIIIIIMIINITIIIIESGAARLVRIGGARTGTTRIATSGMRDF